MSARLFSTIVVGLLICTCIGSFGAPLPDKELWAHMNRDFRYDKIARAKRMEGTGLFRLRLNPKTGAVTAIEVVKSTGWKHLDESAARTLIRWRAKPNSGRSETTVPVTFFSRPP